MLADLAMTGHALLAEGRAMLATGGCEQPHVDAEWLMAGLLGIGRAALYRVLTDTLTDQVIGDYRAAVRRRASGEPLQQILGWEGFRGLTLRITRDVLIPRPETEMLVDVALGLLPAARVDIRPRVIDIGTGSGAIACAIAAERPDVQVIAIDCSTGAARVASDNVVRTRLADRARVIVGDLLSVVRPRRIDLIVANPPYLTDAMLAAAPVEVREHEPRLALAGGPDGLAVVRRIVAAAPSALRTGGSLVLETAGGAQASAVAELLRANAWEDVTISNDLAGVGRFVSGRVTASSVGSAGVMDS
jgi:release factor glutamine methyltransferase